jgi:hypothetical protein
LANSVINPKCCGSPQHFKPNTLKVLDMKKIILIASMIFVVSNVSACDDNQAEKDKKEQQQFIENPRKSERSTKGKNEKIYIDIQVR